MTIDLGAALRRRKPEKRRSQLRPRRDDQLLAAADAPLRPLPIVLDTNVYIRNASGTLPLEVAALLDRARLFHCAVCLAELAAGVAHCDPQHPTWDRTRDHYELVMSIIPDTCILVPDGQIWVEAAILSGILARTQKFQRHQRKEALNDALIFLTAAKAGLPVLTCNRDDFDLLQQLAPEGRFYHYA